MKILLIFNRPPYDGSDVTWNGLRLARKLHDGGNEVRIFLMNDAVDLARNETIMPDVYDQDLVKILKDLITNGVKTRVCATCLVRCGIYKNKPYFSDNLTATMEILANWIVECDRMINF